MIQLNIQLNTFPTFKSLRAYLNKIPNINEGGCGISTYIMYNYLLLKGISKDFKIVICILSNSPKVTPKYNTKLNISNFNHIALKNGNQFIDVNPKYKLYVDKYKEISLEELEYLISLDIWNEKYIDNLLIINNQIITNYGYNKTT